MEAALITKAQKASHDSPRQWQEYFWISVGGEIAFIPLIFVMAGFWDPRKARRQEREHEVWVEGELASSQESSLVRAPTVSFVTVRRLAKLTEINS